MPSNPNAPPPAATANDQASAPQELAQEDFYMERGNLVFTAAYHRKRGFCCNSGCRHCPYGDED